MTTNSTEQAEKEFESWIAHNSTYIEETKRILNEYVERESFDEVEKRVLEDNILKKQNTKYLRDVFREISKFYIPSTESYTETPLMRALAEDIDESIKDWLIYYELFHRNLLYILTTEYLFQEYTEGTMYIDSDDVKSYLTNLGDEHPEIDEWSEMTMQKTSTKYLSALKNFGILQGSNKKEFAVFYVPDEVVAYVFYEILGDQHPTIEEIVGHPDWRLFLFDENDVRRRLDGISPQYIRYERRGSTERIEPVFDDIWEVMDEFRY